MLESPTHAPASRTAAGFAGSWWLVLCLVGLDYFSTLAYLPAMAVEAAGPIAPLGTLVVALVTLAVALPIYSYVVGQSYDGKGAIGLIDAVVHGWAGKLIVLVLLVFVAADFVITRSLSVADGAVHVLANPYFTQIRTALTDGTARASSQLPPLANRLAERCSAQLILTLVLSCTMFALWSGWKGSPRTFLRLAVAVVAFYLIMTGVIVASAVVYLATDGRHLVAQWWAGLALLAEAPATNGSVFAGGWSLVAMALVAFPHLALGLSGFELSLAVAPLVAGSDHENPVAARIRDTRKLLAAAAGIMTIYLIATVFAVTLLVPPGALQDGRPAAHRALAYLAHGGMLSEAVPGQTVNRFFGPAFGTAYDLCSIAILCLAGASVTVALRGFVPEYLIRYGMELQWAHRIGLSLHMFNLIILAVTLFFGASVAAMRWAYAASVMMLMGGAAFAGLVSIDKRLRGRWFRRLVALPFTLATGFFLLMTLLAVFIAREGLEIPLLLMIGMLVASAISRWVRSTELRFEGFEFTNDHSQQRWESLRAAEFQVLVPHRPGRVPVADKNARIRKEHRLSPDVPVVFLEVYLGDTSEFLQKPVMKVASEDGLEVMRVYRCASIAHVIAAVGLELSKVGRPPEIHFGWSDETPLAANLNFLLFGAGNIPWMVRELVRIAEPEPARQPRIIIG